MKLIHTADWHLGHRLCDCDRREEHDHFLNLLLAAMQNEKPDALIVAGDIFDMGNPPNYALKQYYDFLRRALPLCPNIIITGGNHDSVATLNAPRALLRHFKVHVVGGVVRSEKRELLPDAEIVEVKSKNGGLLGVVAAVPFLRERDLRAAEAGETYGEREKRIREGIKEHYRLLADRITERYGTKKVPLVAVGHLFAAGSSTSDSERDIHVGNRGYVSADTFPQEFGYVALGHIHKPQTVGKQEHIRYSGSPIPLSFGERKHQKQLLVVEFGDNPEKPQQIRPIGLQPYRSLLQFKGSLEEVEMALLAFSHAADLPQAWAEVRITTDKMLPDADARIRELAEGRNLSILKVHLQFDKLGGLADEAAAHTTLDDLTPIEVFEKRCETAGIQNKAELEALKQTFGELLEWMDEDKDT